MARSTMLLSSSEPHEQLPASRLRIGLTVRRALRNAKLRWQVASYSRRVAREPENMTALAEFAAFLEGEGLADRSAETYARLALVAARRRDAEAAAFCCLKLDRFGFDDMARVCREVAPVLAEAGRYEAAYRACRRVVEDYVAAGHAHAAAGYLKQLPPLGPRAAEILVEFTAIVTDRSRPTARSQAPAVTSAPEAARDGVLLSGTLGRITVYDVVQIAESNAVTGRLDVDAPLGSATVYFSEGRIVAARYRSERGREAARAIFEIASAPFRVLLTDSVPADEFKARTNTGLLLDVLREADEAARALAAD